MSDILTRLRDAARNSVQTANGSDIFKAAADEIERLRAKNFAQRDCISMLEAVIRRAGLDAEQFSAGG